MTFDNTESPPTLAFWLASLTRLCRGKEKYYLPVPFYFPFFVLIHDNSITVEPLRRAILSPAHPPL
jgi:hypothetical protein